MTVLVDSPTMILATVATVAGGRIVQVMMSTLIQSTDELYAAVRDVLVSHCHSVIGTASIPDPEWMFGMVERQTFAVYDQCPGAADHVCLHERQVLTQKAS